MSDDVQRRAIVFPDVPTGLVGVADIPARPCRTALVVVTGGPQYRVGSHRQFALLCRVLAAAGFAAMTFDFRGSGDSPGCRSPFDSLDADIRSAIDAVLAAAPGTDQVVLLGLCDAASAILMYAADDPRVAGLVMLNPWVRGSGTLERARIGSYYPARLASISFWKRVLTGRVNIVASVRSYFAHRSAAGATSKEVPQYVRRMERGAQQYSGRILLVLSGDDMTANEFRDLLADSPAWSRYFSSADVRRHEIEAANHTFSRAEWRDQVAQQVLAFLQQAEN